MMLPVKDHRLLWLVGLASLILYIFLPPIATGLTLAEPSMAAEVFPGVPKVTQESLAALHDAGSHKPASVAFAAVMLGLFGGYLLALQRTEGVRSFRFQAWLFVAGAAFLTVLILAPIMLSTDVYAYAIYGRVVSIYHANPYDATPPVSPTDPFMPLFGQEYLPSWYGPLWTFISAALAKIGGVHVGLTVLLFRGTAVACALGCAACIWASLRRFAPERAAQGLVFFLWNPLLVMETGLSGHNDSVMLVLVLLGVWLHLRGWKTAAVAALTFSALIKFLTGMLVPLYILLVLRQLSTWRERLFFLVRSGVTAGVICLAAMYFTRSHSDMPAQHQAIAPDFYANNFHELIFKGLRRGLGEDAESTRTPIYFQGWWMAATTNTFLRTQTNDEAEVREYLDPGAPLLVVAPQLNEWARVYDPGSKQFGYADSRDFSDATAPASAQSDPVVKKFEAMSADWPTVRTANNIVRVATWLLFAAFGLWCAWRTSNFEEFVVWSAAALLASCFLIITEIWPWYVNWALALAALATHRAPARLVVLLSAGVMTLNITLGFVGGVPAWVAAYRSVPAFLFPLFAWLVLYSRRIPKHATG